MELTRQPDQRTMGDRPPSSGRGVIFERVVPAPVPFPQTRPGALSEANLQTCERLVPCQGQGKPPIQLRIDLLATRMA
jgi:hypothetical protein